MSIQLKIPAVGESITQVEIGEWHKAEGDRVTKDEVLVEIETDKATVELPAPVSGVLTRILKRRGDTADVGEAIAYIDEGEGSAGKAAAVPAARKPAGKPEGTAVTIPSTERVETGEARPSAPEPQRPAPPRKKQAVSAPPPEPSPPPEAEPEAASEETLVTTPAMPREHETGDREEEEVPMSPIRRRIAQRLVEAHQTAALLTTFNEIDMSAVTAMRQEYRQGFEAKYGVRLGLMSFFVKAAIDALKLVPQINAEIRGRVIVYRNYYDIGIAIAGGKGLVVPVLRNAERMSFAEIELAIKDFADRARANKITLEELEGGTFTITNGGVFGSLLSTPIVNPPQSGILGLHVIQDRPVAREGQVVIRPLMYVALTYDHRIVDGREAVTFLKHIKEVIETPARMLIEI